MNNQDTKSKRIMFFSAHPDDEIGSAGGFILKTLRSGGKVCLVLCIDPAEPRFDTNSERDDRLAEFAKVSETLGAEHSFLDFGHYPELSYKNILPCIKKIRDFKPDIVLTLQESDYHTEHKLIARIVKRAVWHAGRSAFPDCGSPHKVTAIWEAEGDRPMAEPNHLEDISTFIDDKEKIFSLYDSQQKRKDLASAFRGMNRFRGVMYKKGDYAEAFKVSQFFYG